MPKAISTKGISNFAINPKVIATPVIAKVTTTITKAKIRIMREVKHPNTITISFTY